MMFEKSEIDALTMAQANKLKRVFSVSAVKKRYALIGHTPCRMDYGAGDSTRSCLLGSFEHATLGKEKINDGVGVARVTGIPEALIRAMEAGWERWFLFKEKCGEKEYAGFSPNCGGRAVGESWGGRTRLRLPPLSSPLRRAYDHGKQLAATLKPRVSRRFSRASTRSSTRPPSSTSGGGSVEWMRRGR